ncbi:MAG: VWA domain-containing protein [Acidobacteria bacterium]|nr:VWA domain-containing protein [Acidobacteriota bacterium]
MIRGRSHVVASTLALLFLAPPAAAQQPTPPPQSPAAQWPTFKSRVTVVPVDVRVVDRNGNPVKDLKQEDFTILEDGAPQRIVQFSFQELSPASTPGREPLAFRKPLGETVAPQSRRIFLIVLGRGRQTGPVKAVQAAKTFISTRLLPQDQVAVLAYNRATDFTADHARVIDTIERYWQKHEGIEAKLQQRFSGLAAQYGGGRYRRRSRKRSMLFSALQAHSRPAAHRRPRSPTVHGSTTTRAGTPTGSSGRRKRRSEKRPGWPGPSTNPS